MLLIRSIFILSLLILVVGCSSSQNDELKWDKLALKSGDNVTGLCFVDSKLGYAVTATGEVFQTADGGKVFTKLENGSGGRLENVTFLSEEIGFVYGKSGVLRRTSDGAKTWNSISVDISYDLRDMAFLDKEHGYLAGVITSSELQNRGIIGSSADQGATWKFDTTAFKGFHLIETAKPDHLWITGIDAVLYLTEKDSEWQHNVSQSKDTVRAVAFGDIVHGWSVGDHGLLRYSSDGGWSWHDKPRITGRNLTCLIEPKSDVVYIAGDGVIAVTTNHGRQWTVDSVNYPVLFNDCQAAGSDIFLAGARGTILKLKR